MVNPMTLKPNISTLNYKLKTHNPKKITIDIAVISGEQLITYRDPDIGNTEYYDTIGLFIEHLQIPCSFIKKKNFRSL